MKAACAFAKIANVFFFQVEISQKVSDFQPALFYDHKNVV